MKRLKQIIMGGCAAFILASCSDDDHPAYTPAPTINIVQNDLVFPADGRSSILIVEAEGEISATTDADWCEATVSGHTVTVTAQPNGDFIGRTALLTVTAGAARRQLPVQQLGLVLDLPMTVSGHHSPTNGDEFTVSLAHSLPLDIETNRDWVHPVVEGNTLRVTVDSNRGGHLRRAHVVCRCGDYVDTLRIAQYDVQNDVVGSYYMLGSYGGIGGAPASTRFDIIERNDSLFMHWPQERYADAYIHTPLDEVACTLFLPSGFYLYSDTRSATVGYFYDTNGTLAVNSGVGVYATLYSYENSELLTTTLAFANWPGHEVGGFIVRNTSLVTTTVLQLAEPVLVRVGPPGTSLTE